MLGVVRTTRCPSPPNNTTVNAFASLCLSFSPIFLLSLEGIYVQTLHIDDIGRTEAPCLSKELKPLGVLNHWPMSIINSFSSLLLMEREK